MYDAKELNFYSCGKIDVVNRMDMLPSIEAIVSQTSAIKQPIDMEKAKSSMFRRLIRPHFNYRDAGVVDDIIGLYRE